MAALELIASFTVTSTTTGPTMTTHSFTNIPQTYKHLIIHGYFFNPETIHDGRISITQGAANGSTAGYMSKRSGFDQGSGTSYSGGNVNNMTELRKNTPQFSNGIPQYFSAWLPFYTQTSADYGTRLVGADTHYIGNGENYQARWWGMTENAYSFAAVTQLNIRSYPGETVGDKVILYGLGT